MRQTQAVISVPLVARRTLAGVGASGVVARLFRATSVPTCRTLIYVCDKHAKTHTERNQVNECRNTWPTKRRNMPGLCALCDLRCVNCFL